MTLLMTAVMTLMLFWGIKRLLNACQLANQTPWGKAWLNHLDGLNRLFCKKYHQFQYTPIELPPQGSALVMANHVSGLDPFLLLVATCRPIHFLIAREQYDRFGFTWLFRAIGCIPVDREGHPEVALRAALRALEEGKVIALFPQGKIVLPEHSQKLKRGGLWLAQHTHSPIYPAHIFGIRGVGHVFRGILWPSRARLVSYPPIQWTEQSDSDRLRILLEGKEGRPKEVFEVETKQ